MFESRSPRHDGRGDAATTRRAFLAAAGTAAVAGCSGPFSSGTTPSIECTPEDHAWPMHGHGPERRSHVPARDLPGPDAGTDRLSQTGSRTDGGGSVESPPVVDGDVAYVAGDVRVEARSVGTCERRWAIDPGDGVATSPVLGCGVVYVATLNETLALDRDDGAMRWRVDVGAHTVGRNYLKISGTPWCRNSLRTYVRQYHSGPSASPILVDDTLYAVSATVRVLDAETGDRRWTFETGVSTGGPTVVGDRMLATGANTGIHLLDMASGERERRWPAGTVGSQVVPAGGRLFYRAWNVSDAFVVG